MTTDKICIIITKLRFEAFYGGVAQLARAFGSYPNGHWFKSSRRYHRQDGNTRPADKRPVGQAVKTPPFHGGNRSSILLRVTKKALAFLQVLFSVIFAFGKCIISTKIDLTNITKIPLPKAAVFLSFLLVHRAVNFTSAEVCAFLIHSESVPCGRTEDIFSRDIVHANRNSEH